MSRLYLIFLFLHFMLPAAGQNAVTKKIAEGEKLMEKGDYYYALQFFEDAYSEDSNSVELLWLMAQTYRLYNNYAKALEFYQKVYKREEALIYPESILYLGLMQKMNGQYVAALETFKKAKRSGSTNRKSFVYDKAKRELESTLFAVNHRVENDWEVTLLGAPVNSVNSEFVHTVRSNKLYFSSLRGDSTGESEEVYDPHYVSQLYLARLPELHEITPFSLVNNKDYHVANGSFSIDGTRFYFSACTNDQQGYRCKIMVMTKIGSEWTEPDSLGEVINQPGLSTTMPHASKLGEEEVLFFCQQNPENANSMDLYYSIVRNGNRYTEPKPLKTINSIENELAPYFDTVHQRLYFSSTWHDGLGGYDLFTSQFENGRWAAPKNVGAPINSSYNEVYVVYLADTLYFTSNRPGVQYSINPTCCTDIFRATMPKIEIDTIITPEERQESLDELMARLPIKLYFHNDEPNPRSRDTTTQVNYLEAYHSYKKLLPDYQREYSTGLTGEAAQEAKEDIESFFVEYVDQGLKNLNLFLPALLKELEKGEKIDLMIKGFASPLAQSDYNVNLTKRRIQSLIRYIAIYQDSIFKPYLFGTAANGGKLTYTEIPFGEDKSAPLVSDNINDKKNSVYSRAAGLERKIEILGVRWSEVQDSAVVIPDADVIQMGSERIILEKEMGTIPSGTKQKIVFDYTNTSGKIQQVLDTQIPCHCSSIEFETRRIGKGQQVKIMFYFDPEGMKGPVEKKVTIFFTEGAPPLELRIKGNVE